jgi:methyl-accepting chemotaxis protein
MISNLVPDLGVIALVESPGSGRVGGRPVTASGFRIESTGNAENPNFTFKESPGVSHRTHLSRIPPPVNRLDVHVAWPSTRLHFELETPGKVYRGVLWVQSRPSAVLRSFFSGSEFARGLLFDLLIGIATLFLFVEFVAVIIGVSLSKRVTGAVQQLYEGTRRVTHGDFRRLISVRTHDQLGELAESFNQMTGNLERLLVVETEKKRLQAGRDCLGGTNPALSQRGSP